MDHQRQDVSFGERNTETLNTNADHVIAMEQRRRNKLSKFWPSIPSFLARRQQLQTLFRHTGLLHQRRQQLRLNPPKTT